MKRILLFVAVSLALASPTSAQITFDDFLGPAGDAYWFLEAQLRGAEDAFAALDVEIDAQWEKCSPGTAFPGNQRNIIRYRFLFERTNQGRSLEHAVQVWACWDEEPTEPIPLPGENPARLGPVSFQGQAFTDDAGPFKGFGATCMWCLWGEKNDRARLLQNLDYLSARGVNYVRILSLVGGPYWAGLEVDPNQWSDYWAQLGQLLDDVRARNMRVELVIFGDAQYVLADQAERIAHLNRMAAFLEGKRDAVQFVEIANESTGIGLRDNELAELAGIWRRTSTIPMAASSVYDDPARFPLTGIESFFEDYPGLQVDLLTPHFDRDQREDGYRPTRQPWHAQFFEHVPTYVFTNNEPVGCGSSVESQCDPGRIVADFLQTFASRGAGYVWHTEAGVRGRSNYWDLENAEAQLLAIRHMMRLLPGNIANGQNCNHHWACHPYANDNQIWPDSNGNGVVRMFAIEGDGVFHAMLVGLRGKVEITAKWPMGVEVFDAVSGTRLETVELAGGEFHTFFQQGSSRDYVHRITRR